MRILRIANIPNNRTGGMSRTMYCTGDVLEAMGHHVDYLFSEDFSPVPSNFLRGWSLSLQIPALLAQLEQQGKRYDVVEIHEPLSAGYGLVRKFGKILKQKLPPMVIFSYGIERRSQIAELTYKQAKGLPLSLPLKFFRMTVLLSNIGLSTADHIICSNSEDISYLEKKGIPRTKLTQHHSGAEPDFLAAGLVASGEHKTTESVGVLFVGSWIPRKGTLDLIPAMTEIMGRYPTLQFTVAGCGDCAEDILGGFPTPLHSRIKVIPRLDKNEELIEIYRQHSIFVLPSYFEGQPLVMMEAAAMGLAIVTTNICGMADFIDNQENGLTVAVGDIAALKQTLDDLVAHPSTTQSLGEAARQKVQNYTWENAAHIIAKAYEQALKDTNHR
jgi:glycosyltransferase involved in cell wall biosynthesis